MPLQKKTRIDHKKMNKVFYLEEEFSLLANTLAVQTLLPETNLLKLSQKITGLMIASFDYSPCRTYHEQLCCVDFITKMLKQRIPEVERMNFPQKLQELYGLYYSEDFPEFASDIFHELGLLNKETEKYQKAIKEITRIQAKQITGYILNALPDKIKYANEQWWNQENQPNNAHPRKPEKHVSWAADCVDNDEELEHSKTQKANKAFS